MKKMDSYDIIEKAVQKYWKETYPQDVIAFFYQKYDYESDDKWEHCNELVMVVSDSDYEDMEFEIDFCEGQTDVKDIHIVSLREVMEFYREQMIDKKD